MFNICNWQTWEDPNHTDPSTNCKGDNDPIDVCEIGSTIHPRYLESLRCQAMSINQVIFHIPSYFQLSIINWSFSQRHRPQGQGPWSVCDDRWGWDWLEGEVSNVHLYQSQYKHHQGDGDRRQRPSCWEPERHPGRRQDHARLPQSKKNVMFEQPLNRFQSCQATVEWFKIYKMPDGKPANEFAFNSEPKNKEFAENIIAGCHESWKKLSR